MQEKENCQSQNYPKNNIPILGQNYTSTEHRYSTVDGYLKNSISNKQK